MAGCCAQIERDQGKQGRDELRIRNSQKEHAKKNERNRPPETFFAAHARIITCERYGFWGEPMKRDFEELDDIQQKVQTIPEQLPILPVRDAVIFPNAVIPLTVGRESSVRLINEVQQKDGMLVVLTQRDKRVDSPTQADLYDIGTVSMVHRAMKTPEGNLFVIIMGVSRVRIEEFLQFEPYLRARIRPIPDDKEEDES